MNQPIAAQCSDVAASELHIEIDVRSSVCWTGTRAQLEAEGLSPKGRAWPTGRECVSWIDGGLGYRVFRARPTGYKGSYRSWQDADSWRLFCEVPNTPGRHEDARLWHAERAVAQERFRRSAAGMAQEHRCMAAYNDDAFRSFLAAVLPERKKPGRKPRAQGGST